MLWATIYIRKNKVINDKMYDLGYLAIDFELGGPMYFTGGHSILELAMLPFPNPREEQSLSMDAFLEKYIISKEPNYYIIKPYAPVEPEILKDVLGKTLEYYESNGRELSAVITDVVAFIRDLRKDYSRIVPVSDWYGDVTALEYMVSRSGEHLKDLLNDHNMLHVKSFFSGKFGGGNGFERRKKDLGVTTVHKHEADMDCRETAEAIVRAQYYGRHLRIAGGRTKDRTRI
jgi:hypothetical protein